MKYSLVTLTCLAIFITVIPAYGANVFLDNTGTGASLDNIVPADIGTAAATVNVTEISGLTLTVTGLTTGNTSSAPILNSTANSLGINATGDTNTERFESAFAQSVTFQFNQAVQITQLDFTNFSSGEVFDFAGQSISNGDLSNGTTDIYVFGSPFSIAANTNFTLQATSGTIGIEAFDVTVVPEPSAFLLLALFGLLVSGRSWVTSRVWNRG